MELYFLRHGIAEASAPLPLARDSARRLTGEGARKMRRIAQGMLSLDLSLDLILSSPYARARETAEIVARECGITSGVEFTDSLVPGGSPEALIREILAHHGSPGGILVVGHEPYLSSCIAMLLSGKDACAITMKKGGLCKLTIAGLRWGRCATLEWLLTPAQLRRL